MKEFRETVGSHMVNGYEVGDISLPTLVCLHGMTGDSKSFLGLAEQLVDDFHLILLDGPGHGETDPLQTEADYIFSSVVKRMDKVIQKKIPNKPFYILGHSWGADLALHFAKAFPDKILSVVLLDGGFVFPEHVEGMTEEKALTGWQDYIEDCTYRSWEEIVQMYQGYTTKQWDERMDSNITSNFIKDNTSYILKADAFSLLSTIKAFYKEPASTTYQSVKCPVLLFYATVPESDPSRDSGINEIKKSIKDLKVIGLENTKHNIHWDCPERVAEEILLWHKGIRD